MRMLRRAVIGLFAWTLLAGVMAFCPVSALADEAPRSSLELRQLQGLLDLSLSQIRHLAPILKAYRDQHKARLASFRADLKSMLSPEQATRFDALCKQYRRGQGPARGLQELQQELSLSSDQVARIAALRRSVREKAQADYEAFVGQVRGVLTPEQFARFQEVTQRERESDSR